MLLFPIQCFRRKLIQLHTISFAREAQWTNGELPTSIHMKTLQISSLSHWEARRGNILSARFYITYIKLLLKASQVSGEIMVHVSISSKMELCPDCIQNSTVPLRGDYGAYSVQNFHTVGFDHFPTYILRYNSTKLELSRGECL